MIAADFKLHEGQPLDHACGFLVASGYQPGKMSGVSQHAKHAIPAASLGYMSGTNFEGLGRMVLEQRGERANQHSSNRIIEAALSTGGIAEGAGDAINYALNDHFESSPDSLAGIRKQTQLENYRLNERYRLDNLAGMQPLPRGGKASDVSTKMDLPEKFRGLRKALIGQFDEQDLIDFPWLMPEVAKLGAVAARNFLMAMSWKPMLANDDLADGTAFFHSSRGNDADLALTETNLASTIASLNTQTANGESTGHRAKYLVVAEALLYTARKLVRAMKLNDGEDLIVRSDPRIENGVSFRHGVCSANKRDSPPKHVRQARPSVSGVLPDRDPQLVRSRFDESFNVIVKRRPLAFVPAFACTSPSGMTI